VRFVASSSSAAMKKVKNSGLMGSPRAPGYIAVP
jgi:hypothetical protein